MKVELCSKNRNTSMSFMTEVQVQRGIWEDRWREGRERRGKRKEKGRGAS